MLYAFRCLRNNASTTGKSNLMTEGRIVQAYSPVCTNKHLISLTRGSSSPYLKLHLSRFHRFRKAPGRDHQTHRQTTLHQDICSKRPHLAGAATRSKTFPRHLEFLVYRQRFHHALTSTGKSAADSIFTPRRQ